MSNQKIVSFTDLKAWQEGHKLALLIYKLTKEYPKEERYSLVDQMRRAAVSITSNIAEGFGRQSYKEKIRFYFIARGSLTEVTNQVILSKDISYLENNDYEKCFQQIITTQKILSGLITKTKSFL